MVGVSGSGASPSGVSGAPPTPAADGFDGRFTLGTEMGAALAVQCGSRTRQTITATGIATARPTSASCFDTNESLASHDRLGHTLAVHAHLVDRAARVVGTRRARLARDLLGPLSDVIAGGRVLERQPERRVAEVRLVVV